MKKQVSDNSKVRFLFRKMQKKVLSSFVQSAKRWVTTVLSKEWQRFVLISLVKKKKRWPTIINYRAYVKVLETPKMCPIGLKI